MPTDNRRLPIPEDSKCPHSYAKSNTGKGILPACLGADALRSDGRKHNEMRPVFIKVGVVSQAQGSAYIELDKTKVLCAVYGPREVTKREDFSMKGQLNCEIKFATFSCLTKRSHQQDSQEKDMSVVLEQALEPAVCMEKFPKARLDVFVTVLEDDGGALAAAMTCASAALASGKVEMFDIVVGCSMRQFGLRSLLDPCNIEEFKPQPNEDSENNAGMTVGYLPSLQQVSALVQTGQIDASVAQQGIKLCIATCQRVFPIVQQALVRAIHSQTQSQEAS